MRCLDVFGNSKRLTKEEEPKGNRKELKKTIFKIISTKNKINLKIKSKALLCASGKKRGAVMSVYRSFHVTVKEGPLQKLKGPQKFVND